MVPHTSVRSTRRNTPSSASSSYESSESYKSPSPPRRKSPRRRRDSSWRDHRDSRRRRSTPSEEDSTSSVSHGASSSRERVRSHRSPLDRGRRPHYRHSTRSSSVSSESRSQRRRYTVRQEPEYDSRRSRRTREASPPSSRVYVDSPRENPSYSHRRQRPPLPLRHSHRLTSHEPMSVSRVSDYPSYSRKRGPYMSRHLPPSQSRYHVHKPYTTPEYRRPPVVSSQWESGRRSEMYPPVPPLPAGGYSNDFHRHATSQRRPLGPLPPTSFSNRYAFHKRHSLPIKYTVDRRKTCPFLLRVFYHLDAHFPISTMEQFLLSGQRKALNQPTAPTASDPPADTLKDPSEASVSEKPEMEDIPASNPPEPDHDMEGEGTTMPLASESAPEQEPVTSDAFFDSELQLYVWKDTSLRDIIDLVKDLCPPMRARNARASLKLLHFNEQGSFDATDFGVLHSSRPHVNDRRTLYRARLEIGDILSIAILRPPPRVQQQQTAEPARPDVDFQETPPLEMTDLEKKPDFTQGVEPEQTVTIETHDHTATMSIAVS